jgi:hypothetical protein
MSMGFEDAFKYQLTNFIKRKYTQGAVGAQGVKVYMWKTSRPVLIVSFHLTNEDFRSKTLEVISLITLAMPSFFGYHSLEVRGVQEDVLAVLIKNGWQLCPDRPDSVQKKIS